MVKTSTQKLMPHLCTKVVLKITNTNVVKQFITKRVWNYCNIIGKLLWKLFKIRQLIHHWFAEWLLFTYNVVNFSVFQVEVSETS